MTKDNKRNTAIYTAFEECDPSDVPTPEKGLLRAILLNAISDMNREGEHARKARSYFLSREDDYIFSFQAVCSYLNINPNHILVLVGLEQPTRQSTSSARRETQTATTGSSDGPPESPTSVE